MDNASTATPRISYPFPPTEIIARLETLIANPVAKGIIKDLVFSWIPRQQDYDALRKIAKQSKDVIKNLKYITEDSRTPDVFMSSNGPALITYSKCLDNISKFERYYPLEGIENLSRSYMLPGVEVTSCGNCDRVFLSSEISKELTSSRTLANIYGLKLNRQESLCPFEFVCLCVEIEYLYPDISEPVPIPTLPDGRPVIWIGDPGWAKHSEEHRQKSLQYQRNF